MREKLLISSVYAKEIPSYHVKPEIQALCGFDEFLYLLKQSLMGMDIIVSGTE